MATTNKVFIPTSWVPDKITVSASSQSVALTGLTKSEDSIEITNLTTETIYVSFSAGAGTATTNSVAITSGSKVCYGLTPDVTYANAIGTGSTGVIQFLVGKGA